MLCGAIPGRAAEVSLESAPPVVVKTEPVAGTANVDPRTSEIVVQFSKPMQDGSWSWSTWGEENFPEMVGQPKYAADGRTCVLKVKLQPGKFYATWLNSDKFKNFTDTAGRPAVPYLLTFTTASDGVQATRAPAAIIAEVVATISQCAEGDPRVEAALKSLRPLDQAQVVAALIPHLDAVKDTERRSAIYILWKGEFENITPAAASLQKLLMHSEDLTRGMAALALGGNQVRESFNALAKMTKEDSSGYARRCAAYALGLLGDARAEPILKEALEDESPLVRHNAQAALDMLKTAKPAPPSAKASGEADASAAASAEFMSLLNDDQRAVLAWTDRQFRSFFDARTFAGWSDEERAALERKLIDALNGPRSTEYYQAINTLAAMRSAKALPRLREIASERVDRNNRDRWMAIRALGIIGDKESVPDLIHLVYHGNVNTRWWAQISLVRITRQNFGKDWTAWGKWWNDQKGEPPYKPEIIRWWNGQAEPEKLAGSLDESDQKFLESLRGKSAATPAPGSSPDLAARLRAATPVMEGIREAWSAAVAALQSEDARNALASLQTLAPRIQEFRDAMKGTPFEAGTAESLKTLGPLIDALENGNLEAARTALQPMLALGKKMEAQVKAITDESPSPRPESAPASAPQIQPEREN